MKRFIVISIFFIPFLLMAVIYIIKQPQWKDNEAKERRELLSDTAKVNAAHRTYEKVKLQQMLDDSDAVELAKKVLEIKGDPTRKAGQ